jgi:acyl-CoA thioesterase FadM
VVLRSRALWLADDAKGNQVNLANDQVEHLGNTSMVSAIGITRDGDILTEERIVHIFVRADRLGEKSPIPDHVRQMLQRYSVEDPDSLMKSPITQS